MRVGAIFSQADSGVDPDAIRRWAQGVEAAGYAHLMAYDHVVGVAAARLGPGPFGNFPTAPYTAEDTFHEIIVLFSHLAAVTTSLEFVTSVLILPQRQAAVVAKQIATLDLLSSGRVRLAVGVGWNAIEYESLGARFAHRTRMLDEQIDVLRALWTGPLVTFSGEFHHLDRVGINPLPTRTIPIYIGTSGSDAALRRVVRRADGWMPLLIPGLDPIDIGSGVRRLREIAEEEGRDPATLPMHGRVYLGPTWQRELDEAQALGFSDVSIGFNRLADPGRSHEVHLEALLSAKNEIDAMTT
ncbi:MAG: LLM class F420-dependent oxidoreductase [Acidimicrobiia bacterium]